MFTRKDIELLAPAGSYESLMAAIQSGADAVYFGVEKLNMRARSSFNFTLDDLQKVVNICKEHNIKSYLTVNTVIYNHEIGLVQTIIDKASHAGIDAIIASDHAVINYANKKGLEVHVSTQTNISNKESVRFYSKFAEIMVLARELGLEQVQEIFKFIQEENICGPSGKRIRLEMFIHGALCMSISGKCYLSLHQYNYSANRGGCLQACRRGYVVTEKETGNEVEIDNDYMMSPKDLCTIPFLNKILDSGVQVLKIEGRARSPEYVKVVTECYNEAINAYLENDYTQDKIDNWLKQLKTVFNRGFWNGYYLGQPLGEWSHVYGSQARERKEYIGKINNYFTNIQVAEMLLEAGELELNEEIYIIGPTTGVLRQKVEEIRVDLKNTNKAAKGDTLSIPCKTFLRRSDKVYKIIKN